MTRITFDCDYFARNVNKELKSITYNIKQYCKTLEETLPTTITDNLRGFHYEIKPNGDYSAIYLYFYIYLKKEVLCYHSRAELDELITKASEYPFHIRITDTDPISENNYSHLMIELEFSYYRRGLYQ